MTFLTAIVLGSLWLGPKDSTWCPVYEHISVCRFRLGPWRKKDGVYVRARICSFHKVKQHQYAKKP